MKNQNEIRTLLQIKFNAAVGRRARFAKEQNQVAMMNGDNLESFYSCPECGHEGFMEEISHNRDNFGCLAFINDIGGTISAAELQFLLETGYTND